MTDDRKRGKGRKPGGPIFIQGIMHRSGTNFLYGLLNLHPDCFCGPIREDFLLAHAQKFSEYHDALDYEWSPEWEMERKLKTPDSLYRSIGDGLISFLDMQRDWVEVDKVWKRRPGVGGKPGDPARRMVTKTPSVENLDMFFRLFPTAQLIILVRDGRAVTESAVKSFGWSYPVTMKRWADAASIIGDFTEKNSGKGDRFIVVRYEDLHLALGSEMKRILGFLGLSVKKYDIDAARNLPVSGSSELRTKRKGKLHWDHMEKTSDFDPDKRFAGWGRGRHRRFNWIAGEKNRALGYELKHAQGSGALWAFWNRCADVPMRMGLRMREKGRRYRMESGRRKK